MTALLRLLVRLLALLPLPLLHGTGSVLGSLAALFPNRNRRITLRNLALCFPELSEQQRARWLVLSLRETAKAATETALMWRIGPQRLKRLVRGVEGEPLLREAITRGKGVIIASPHLGSWELIGQYLQLQHPLTSMYKPAKNVALDRVMHEGRSHLGMQLAPTDTGGIRILLAALRRGELIGILPDQNPRSGAGVFAPFFGITTDTMTLLPKLAARSGAPVLVAYAERLGWGRGYRIHFLPVDGSVHDRDETVAAAALNRAIETAVRQTPTQYAWSYKRFRRRPEGEPSLY
ncbi:MAG: lysophospholipid acyltransferase family protein [Gammaproteobacteria bacterium]|nr:lysophospholipid acyltransferase family protein [Gammaproteobacteria bacterium]MCW8927857.1 lysophospholipid acyltransferase family protein [Gammaproteobacteria bacterium]MCW8959127.1 lysophospholipid acyltransferase family protein [Gammaproteobacteria bacterium]MCW8972181.1 lysophospholipid acyltransferase family protein [Gammaproteobacteria bacterium]MCW8991831.1 lysophospholipid acyltransferase family protein [Gammaproteobacteria bacterium]